MTPTLDAKQKAVRPVFMRLDQQIGWQAAATNENVFFDAALGGLRLGDPLLRPIPYNEPGGTFGGLTRPTGLAVGEAGRLFIADTGGNRILTYSPADGKVHALWSPTPAPETNEDCHTPPATPPDAYTLSAPRGLALSPGGDLVVADTGHGRIIFYTWPDLLPRIILNCGGEPWDIAFDQGGRLYMADAAAQRVWRYDRLWRLDHDYRGGVGQLSRPRHLALDAAGRLYVLDDGLGQVVALTSKGRVDIAFTLAELEAASLPPPLELADSVVQLPQDEQPNCPRLPLTGLDVDRGGRLPDSGAMILARPAGVTYPRLGTFRTTALDSGLFNSTWHRVVFEAEIPETTSLTVRSFTAATPMDETRIAALPESRWSRAITINPGDQPELLLQSQPGRYLWLDIVFGGNGSATPLVRSIQLYAPRRSSLHFLPPVFHEDSVSADFLDRFLSYFDTIFAELESQIEGFTAFLDPDGVPAGGFLTWLAGWFDLEFLAQWPEATRREFVRRAIELHRTRGTINGLKSVLQLHTGLDADHINIFEHFRLRAQPKRYIGGAAFQPAATEIIHHFTVVLPQLSAPNAEAVATLHRLIEEFKPAHTHHALRFVQPGVRIGCLSTVGVDMIIGRPDVSALDEMRLGQTSQLAAKSHLPRMDHVFLR